MNQPMPSPDADVRDARQRLSDLMDGQGCHEDVEIGIALWRDDTRAREDWHAWHLIGDVMRSDDLASAPVRDEALLTRLRERLADEPPVLAPAPLATAGQGADAGVGLARVWQRRRSFWLSSAAVAAGFVAVAGALVVARSPDAGSDGGAVLSSAPPGPGVGVQRVGAVPASSAMMVLDGQVVRDAQLDAYLRAHRQMLVGAPAAVPGGAMRSVETIAPGR
jgi:sigma-E factor negative regulatory protein RseA